MKLEGLIGITYSNKINWITENQVLTNQRKHHIKVYQSDEMEQQLPVKTEFEDAADVLQLKLQEMKKLVKKAKYIVVYTGTDSRFIIF